MKSWRGPIDVSVGSLSTEDSFPPLYSLNHRQLNVHIDHKALHSGLEMGVSSNSINKPAES
jgi:hypothetical protein